MKGAPEPDPNRCTGISKPLAGGNALCIPDGCGELKAAASGEVVAQPFERATQKELEQLELILSGRGASGYNLKW